MKHFTRTEDFTTEEYLEIFRRMEIFEEGLAQGKSFAHLCPGKVLSTMFFQESTRTSASLQAAIARLGGGWFGIAGIKGTYLESGEEDLEDTLNGVAPLCDIMAIRHKDFDLTSFAEKGFRVPLLNAMCGGQEHAIGGILYPYIIKQKLNKLENIKVGIYGMNKSSRPTKAAVKVLSRFGIKIYEDPSITEFKLPQEIRKMILDHGSFYEEAKLENFIGEIDFLAVAEGLPQAGEDPCMVDKFNKAFIPFTRETAVKMKKSAFFSVGGPKIMTDGRMVAEKEIDNHPQNLSQYVLGCMPIANMALITYLLDVKVK